MPRTLYLCRHGETEWTLSGQHTGVTDIPLTEGGRAQAKALGERLKGIEFKAVYASPLIRAFHTCEITGLSKGAVVDEDLLEWNYGDFEGKKTSEIRNEVPGWSIFSHGAPNGESVDDVTKRADRFLTKLEGIEGNIAIFSSGHFSRVLAARWIAQPATLGRHLDLSTASLSILGTYREDPVIKLWNEVQFR